MGAMEQGSQAMNVLQLPSDTKQQSPEEFNTKLWAVGGGKGGVGKSIISLNLAYWLAKLGHKVVLVDADLGSATFIPCWA